MSEMVLRRLLCDPAHQDLQRQFPKATEGSTGLPRGYTCICKGPLTGSRGSGQVKSEEESPGQPPPPEGAGMQGA